MIGKASRPVIEILTGPLVSGHRAAAQSPRSSSGPKSYDLGGVGLGIVAALQNSVHGGITDNQVDRTVVSRSLRRSVPDPLPRGRKGDDRTPFRIQTRGGGGSVFHISPVRFADAAPAVPPPDFLSSCNLCGKKLHGKDIYMYRGEKAFCSSECRYRQMVVDERKEKCGTEAPPCTAGQMFSDGVLAS